MPRLGPGSSTFKPHILTDPADGFSNPPISRSNVDFPQPDAPIKQTNSPLLMVSDAFLSAKIVPPGPSKDFESALISRMGVPLAMLRAPCQGLAPAPLHDLIRYETGQSDDDHSGNDDFGAGQLARIHDHGAKAGLNPGHFADDDHHPGETEAEPKTREDAGKRGWQDDLRKHRGPGGAEHAGGFEKARIDAADPESCIDQNRIKSPQEDEKECTLRADTENDHRKRRPSRDGHRAQELECGLQSSADGRNPPDQHAKRKRRKRCQSKSPIDARSGRQEMGEEHPAESIVIEAAKRQIPNRAAYLHGRRDQAAAIVFCGGPPEQ